MIEHLAHLTPEDFDIYTRSPYRCDMLRQEVESARLDPYRLKDDDVLFRHNYITQFIRIAVRYGDY